MSSRPAHLTPSREYFTGWGASQFDLDAYTKRVGFDGPLRPDLDTLVGLHRAQPTHISFENLDIVLGRGIDISLEALQRKLIHQRRGGYCYEANLLFAAALEAAGFTVTGALARSRIDSDALRPATHAILLVWLDDDAPWLADAGFGGRGLLEPIRVTDGNESTQGSWRFRLDQVDETEWILSTTDADGWKDLYGFTQVPRYPFDFAVANHFTSTHARSPFTGRLVAQRVGEHTRILLVDTELTVLHGSAKSETTTIAAADIPAVLTERLGISLTDAEYAAVVTAVAAKTG
ncbi:arylamine N-acetyltransferase family protein [Stackebrandtia nassauensis]|uniref:Arylamine N-acetyltransferase n=1 Tax=Stackebrandtia nassauensis (strain DSM 44728 / CIP 108903 / NRRL B-16338 / NBRC 102104 / LLR-40K-21) TaxID=446470 RepID=D3Q6K9_STANL|nr:arylamine N-acetyltransferase [Stackebrandtia nassauensis]ADD44252.1 Arylamine N-acetyltransferase [Stackebrandtia nassauensis DSM 44728]